jgi:hypothetical protein
VYDLERYSTPDLAIWLQWLEGVRKAGTFFICKIENGFRSEENTGVEAIPVIGVDG